MAPLWFLQCDSLKGGPGGGPGWFGVTRLNVMMPWSEKLNRPDGQKTVKKKDLFFEAFLGILRLKADAERLDFIKEVVRKCRRCEIIKNSAD